MTEADANIVEQTVRISARPETVWRYWTDPQRMCDWWGAAAELDPRPGGLCRIAITLQTYSHVLPIMHDAAPATVASLFMPQRRT